MQMLTRNLKLVLMLTVLGSLLAACGGDKKEVEVEPETEEMVTEIKRYWSLQSKDPNVPAEERLYCWYTVVERTEDGAAKYSQADTKTSGQCKWDQLATKAGAPEKSLPADNATALDRVIEGIEFDGSTKKSEWNCAKLEVTTTKREFTTYDCELEDRKEKMTKYVDPMANKPSTSAQEAAFRLNQLIFMK